MFCNFYRLSHGSTIFQNDNSPVETEAGGEGGEDAEQGEEDRPGDQADPGGKQGVHVRYCWFGYRSLVKVKLFCFNYAKGNPINYI